MLSVCIIYVLLECGRYTRAAEIPTEVGSMELESYESIEREWECERNETETERSRLNRWITTQRISTVRTILISEISVR